jgi:hypothetical protein
MRHQLIRKWPQVLANVFFLELVKEEQNNTTA